MHAGGPERLNYIGNMSTTAAPREQNKIRTKMWPEWEVGAIIYLCLVINEPHVHWILVRDRPDNCHETEKFDSRPEVRHRQAGLLVPFGPIRNGEIFLLHYVFMF